MRQVDLARMSTQIAQFFEPYPEEEAVAGAPALPNCRERQPFPQRNLKALRQEHMSRQAMLDYAWQSPLPSQPALKERLSA